MSTSPTLTRKQRKLQKELDQIAEAIGIDYWNILNREPAARTPVLGVTKREMIRGEIVSQYTLIDELLGMKLCKYFFPGKTMIELWKTRRFQRFNYFVIERLYLLHKLALVKDVYNLPKKTAGTIEEINSLRNAVAHAFFPENLRVYKTKGRPGPRKPISVIYKGQDVFTLAGIEKFTADAQEIVELVLFATRKKNNKKVVRPPDIPLPPVD